MSTLTEQFSAARQSQVEAQLSFFQNVSAKAVESAGKIAALNMATTRALVAKTESDFLQLLTVKDPRDLFALTAQTQSGFETLLAYGRALAGIASGAQQAMLPQAKGAPAPAPEGPAALALVSAPIPAAAPDAVPDAAPEAAAELLPAAKAKPIAKAVAKVAKAVPVQAAAPLPAADEAVVVTGLKAVEAAPPPAPVSGTPDTETKGKARPQQQQQQDLLAAAAKPRKKK